MSSLSKKISVILLAGGTGARMGLPYPKQYMKVAGKEIALYSYELFAKHPHVCEIVVVCEPSYESIFPKLDLPLSFARPGMRRQDSTFNGLQKILEKKTLVCVHDTARPCLEKKLIDPLFEAAAAYGAAVLGVPSVSTLKEVDSKGFMAKAIERSTTWVIQTPQVMEYSLLKKGYEEIQKKNLQVTDESSIMAAIGHPVKVVKSSSQNIKMTEPADAKIIEAFLTQTRGPHA